MFHTLLVDPLFNLLATIYAVLPGHDFGIAIIIMTVIVRLLLWPLVNRQLHSQRAMQELAPEIAKVRAKAKGDKQLESRLLMELYKEKEISPFGSMVPLLIQLPIFIALFVVLKDFIKPGQIAELAYEPVKQLPAIQAIISGKVAFEPTLLGLVDLSKPSVVLAVLAGLTQFYQTKQITPKKGQKSAMPLGNLTMIFPVVTGVIALTLPSALALYWSVTSAVAILQQHLVLKRDVTEMEQKS